MLRKSSERNRRVIASRPSSFHHVSVPYGIDPHHECVGGQRAGPAAEHHAPSGEVIQENHPVAEHQRMMVRERRHTGSEPGVSRGRGSDSALLDKKGLGKSRISRHLPKGLGGLEC